jgi:hypothetical protein
LNLILIRPELGLLLSCICPGEVSIQSLQTAHVEWSSRIKSLSFEAESGFEGSTLARHKVFACQGRRLVESIRRTEKLEWRDDPAWNWTLISDGKIEVYWQFARYHEIDILKNDQLQRSKLKPFWRDPFFDFTGWWPEVDSHSDLVSSIIAKKTCEIVSENEVVQDRVAIRVRDVGSNTTEDIWFDSQRQGVVLKRMTSTNVNGHTSSLLRVNSNFVEIQKEIWLPTVNEWTNVVDAEVRNSGIRRFSNIRVNEQSDLGLKIAILPGTIVVDKRDVPQSVKHLSGGVEVLDDVARLLQRLVELDPKRVPKGFGWDSFINSFFSGAVVSLFCTSLWQLYRICRGKTSNK